MKLTITAGGSRKLNNQAYGGFAYESSDVWVSIGQEIEGTDFDARQLAKKLQKEVRKLLEEETDEKIKEIKANGKQQVPFTQ